MSREAFERVVRAFEEWDAGPPFDDRVCLHAVSKLVRGEYQVQRRDDHECPPDCRTRKHFSQTRAEVQSGPCDSEASSQFNGTLESELVAAYMDADPSQRGGLGGRFKWGSPAGTIVGRSYAIINAGTHHEPHWNCEACDQPYHAEGWIRAAVVEGEHEGCRISGAFAYNVDPRGEGEAGVFVGTLEGLLICQCD